MSAESVWREGQGMSKQKTVRIIWPELAAALDGAAGPDGAPDAQPARRCCTTRCTSRTDPNQPRTAAVCLMGGTPMCEECAADPRFANLRRAPL